MSDWLNQLLMNYDMLECENIYDIHFIPLPIHYANTHTSLAQAGLWQHPHYHRQWPENITNARDDHSRPIRKRNGIILPNNAQQQW